MTAAQPIVAGLLANGENSSICLEENCLNPFADSYLCSQGIYNLCLEETENITLCACGCGKEIIIKYWHLWKNGRGIPKYIRGHCPMSEETKRKIGRANAIALRGRKVSPEAIEKTRRANIGRKPWNTGKGGTDAVKNLSKAHKGQVAWNKGLQGYLSEESITRLRNAASGENNPNFRKYGRDNHSWKGGRKVSRAKTFSRRKQRGFILISLNNPYNEPIEYHHIHPDLPYVVPCPTRIHQMFKGRKTHFQNVNTMLGIVGVIT